MQSQHLSHEQVISLITNLRTARHQYVEVHGLFWDVNSKTGVTGVDQALTPAFEMLDVVLHDLSALNDGGPSEATNVLLDIKP